MLIQIKKKEQTVYALETQKITFALAIKSKEMLCGFTIWRTEHPKLVIFEQEEGLTLPITNKNSVNDLDIFTYVNSKFVYVERHIRSQLKQLYQEVITQRCNIERETLKNGLSIATQTPDQFAYNLMKGPGYMAVTAGEVVHVIKCIPVDVKIKHSENCYAELQVTRGNQTLFMSPITHILKTHGTRINCNPLLPAYYYVDETWYKILPSLVEAKQPTIVHPISKPVWEYINPESLATSGIYQDKDLQALRDRIMFPIEQEALLNNVAREIHGHPVNYGESTISKLLNTDAVEKIVETTWSRIWNKFISFGTASAGILAIFMIIQGLKMIVEILINGYVLHQVYGWSIHLLGAVWSALARLLIHLGNSTKVKSSKYQKVDVEQGNLTELRSLQTTMTENPENNQPSTNKSNEAGFFSLPS